MQLTMFLTHHNLQGSQTRYGSCVWIYKFLTHHNLQGSQTIELIIYGVVSFLPIIIYKVLKLRFRFSDCV